MSCKSKDTKKAKDSTGDVYQKFLDFLKSPMWVLPVMSFVEQRSVVFDKDQGDEQMYSKIHSEFRGMVDMLIQCFCDDSGVKPQQVAEAIKREEHNVEGEKKGPSNSVEWPLLEPVIAANDANLFVHMMTRKNIELQLQAVQMIEIMCGLIPAVLVPTGQAGQSETVKNADEQEKIILLQVMRQSKEDYEKQKAKNEARTKEVEEAMQQSLAEKERLVKAQKHEEELVQEALKLSLKDDEERKEAERSIGSRKSVAAIQRNIDPKGIPTELPVLKTRAMSVGASTVTEKLMAKVANANVGGTTADPVAMVSLSEKPPDVVTDEAVRKRQEYLRQQRDKLLAMKREAREVAFSKAEADGKQTRPKTARAAKAALRGGLKGDIPPISDDVLAARRALAEKLKHEVIGNV